MWIEICSVEPRDLNRYSRLLGVIEVEKENLTSSIGQSSEQTWGGAKSLKYRGLVASSNIKFANLIEFQ